MAHTIRYAPVGRDGQREVEVITSNPPIFAGGAFTEIHRNRLMSEALDGEMFHYENDGKKTTYTIANVRREKMKDGSLEVTFDLLPS
jgi:hypothetical protein